MAVVIETTLGDITVDLFLEQRPVTCLNFLKLCKMKYYNFNLFHSIRSGFIAQTGDPTGEGNGGESIFGVLEGPMKRFFSGEKMPKIRHTNTGLLSMVGTGDVMIGSQFFFTLGSDLDSLDGAHCVIGEVTEGHDVLRKLNEVICDETHRPYQDVRITHTVVLEDPFNDPTGLRAPSRSPSPSAHRLKGGRIAPDEELDEAQGKSAAEVQEMIEEKEAKARATILEIVGDIPDADIAPPENVLFVCKLNPVTTDEDLEIIFSRFGKIVSCEVIRDKKSGDSLQYAFIEFSDKKSCEDAYFKMDNVLIDDRRIHVDFSQSVSKIKWLGKGRGVKHFTDEEIKEQRADKDKSKKPLSRERESRNEHRDHPRRDKDRHSNSARHREEIHDKNRSRDRRYRNDKETNLKSRRSRSKSRSKRERSKSLPRTENSREKPSKRESNLRNHGENYSNPQNIEKQRNDQKRNNSYNESKEPDNYSSTSISHKSKSKPSHVKNIRSKSSPVRNVRPESRLSPPRSPSRKHKERPVKTDDRNSNNNHSTDTNHMNEKHHNNEIDKNKLKHKIREDRDVQEVKNKKSKPEEHHKKTRTPTPTPKMRKKEDKITKKESKEKKGKPEKKSKVVKKKRKLSTSSSDTSSSSESSSSSSDTSSSSDSDQKRKRVRRKRKHSSSSSSSTTDSSSSSSSSDTSSESTSSSSDGDVKKKRKTKTNSKKKFMKKSKKK